MLPSPSKPLALPRVWKALVLSNVIAELAKLPTGNDADITARIEAGFKAYDSVRRPRAQKQLEQSAELARMIFFQHEEVEDDMGKILAMLQQGRFDWIWFHDVDKDVKKAVDMMRANQK
jgi:salicylate hydroxylase